MEKEETTTLRLVMIIKKKQKIVGRKNTSQIDYGV